jgi:hypothetical protein
LIPTPLAALGYFNNWILWREFPPIKAGDKLRKIPVDWRTGQPASALDVSIHLSYDQAEWFAIAPGNHIGFVFTDTTPFFFVDIDNCLLASGQWSPQALEICAQFQGAAIEISTNGRGLHIIGMHREIPPHACRGTNGLELYTNNRFMALGTDAIGSAHTDCTDAITQVIYQYFPLSAPITPTVWSALPRNGYNGPTNDDTLLSIALNSRSAGGIFGGRASFRQLWEADAVALGAAYPATGDQPYNASSADAALAQHLAFYTGCNAERIKALMMRSALVREKWQREDYLPRTITRACGMQREIYGAKMAAEVSSTIYEAATEDEYYNKFYYLKHGEKFLMHNERGWMTISERSFRTVLAGRGFDTAKGKGLISVADEQINRIRMENDVDYAAPLAGHRSGIYQINDARVLVTKDPLIIDPKQGDYSLIDNLIRGLLNSDPYQIDHFYSWLKIAYQALRTGEFRPGQAIAFVGPKDCGKSLIQSIITQVLGGKESDPYQYMMGLTQFNSNMFQSTHIRIDDVSGSTDIRARRNFGAQIKQIAAKDIQNCHGKGKEALSLNPLWRLTISLNDGLENILVLPPIEEDIEDKLMVFQATRSTAIPADDNRRKEFWNTIISQLPAFVAMLCDYKIPETIRDGRFGVKAYYNPTILSNLRRLQPEERLKEMIDEYIFPPATTENEWVGTADGLQIKLATMNGIAAHNLFGNWPQRCGVLLSRLTIMYPKRFIKDLRNENKHLWKISGP